MALEILKSKATIRRFPAEAMMVVILLQLLSANLFAQTKNLDQRLQQTATLIRDNRLSDAERQLQVILKISPDEADALNLLGTIRASQGRLAEAETLFTRALRIAPQLVGAHMNLAFLYLLKGAPDKTIAELKAVLKLAPDHIEARYKLARLLLSRGQFDECIALIENANPSSVAAFLVVSGDAYLGKGDVNKAEENYLLALGRQSDAVDALLGVTQVAALKNHPDLAATYLHRAKAGITNSPELLYQYALTALKISEYEEARATIEQAIKLQPNQAAYVLLLGAIWLKKPDLFEAEQAFRRALQLQPHSPQGQMYLGYTLLKQKRYSEAQGYLEQCVRNDTTMPEPFYYLALLAQEKNEDDKALEMLTKLAARFPTFVNANVHIAMGSSYMKLKDYAKAQEHLELAVKLHPEEVRAHYNLAMLYARMKEPQRAREEMQIVERLKNRNPQASESDLLSPPAPRRN